MIKTSIKTFCIGLMAIMLTACLPGEDKIFDVQDDALKKLMVERLSNTFSDTLEEDIANFIVEINTGAENETFANRKVKTIRCEYGQLISYIPTSSIEDKDVEILKTDASVKLIENLQRRFGKQSVGYFDGEKIVPPSGRNVTAQGSFFGSQDCRSQAEDSFSVTEGTVTSEIIPKGSPVLFMTLQDIKGTDSVKPGDLEGSIDPRKVEVTKRVYDCATDVNVPDGKVAVNKVVFSKHTTYNLDEDGKRDGVASVKCRLGGTEYSGSSNCSNSYMTYKLSTEACKFVDIAEQPDQINVGANVDVGFSWENYFSGGLTGGSVGRVSVGCFVNETSGVDTCRNLEGMTSDNFDDEKGFEIMGYYMKCSKSLPRQFVKNPTGFSSDGSSLTENSNPSHKGNCGDALGVSGTDWTGDIIYHYRVHQCEIMKYSNTGDGPVSCAEDADGCGGVKDMYYNIYEAAPIAMKCENPNVLSSEDPVDCNVPSDSPFTGGQHYTAKAFEMDKWLLLDPWNNSSVMTKNLNTGTVVPAGRFYVNGSELSQAVSALESSEGLIEDHNSESGYKYFGADPVTDLNADNIDEYFTNSEEDYKVGDFADDVTGCYTDQITCAAGEIRDGPARIGVLVDSSKSMYRTNPEPLSFSMRVCEMSLKSMFSRLVPADADEPDGETVDGQERACEIIDGRSVLLTTSETQELQDYIRPDFLIDDTFNKVIEMINEGADCSTITQDFAGYCAGGPESDTACQSNCPGICTEYERTYNNVMAEGAADLIFKNYIVHNLSPDMEVLVYKDMFMNNSSENDYRDEFLCDPGEGPCNALPYQLGNLKGKYIWHPHENLESNDQFSECRATAERSPILSEFEGLVNQYNGQFNFDKIYIISDGELNDDHDENGSIEPSEFCTEIRDFITNETDGIDITLVVPDYSDTCLTIDVNNNIDDRADLDGISGDGYDVIRFSEASQIADELYAFSFSDTDGEAACQAMYGSDVDLLTGAPEGELDVASFASGDCDIGDYNTDSPNYWYAVEDASDNYFNTYPSVAAVDLPCRINNQHCEARTCRDDDECGIDGTCVGFEPASNETTAECVADAPGYESVCANATRRSTCESYCTGSDGKAVKCIEESGDGDGDGDGDGPGPGPGDGVIIQACAWIVTNVNNPETLGSCQCPSPSDDKDVDESTNYECNSSNTWIESGVCSGPAEDACDSDGIYSEGDALCCDADPTASCFNVSSPNPIAYRCTGSGSWEVNESFKCPRIDEPNCTDPYYTGSQDEILCCFNNPSGPGGPGCINDK